MYTTAGYRFISGLLLLSAILFVTPGANTVAADLFPIKENSGIVLSDSLSRPYVVAVSPEGNSREVDQNTSVSTSILALPNGGIDNATISKTSVYLVDAVTGNIVPSNSNGTGGGDAITLVPDSALNLNTTYIFHITDSVKDVAGVSIIPFSDTFTTATVPAVINTSVKFDKISLPNTVGQHSSLVIGPDGKLYALNINGIIERYLINRDGTLQGPESLYSLQDGYGARKRRLAIGFAFDPLSTANNLIAWVTHSSYVFNNGPDWDGKLTKLSGHNLQNVRDVLVNLPRSLKDHLTNSIAFGPDGALYFTQGSNSAMGSADRTWAFREEKLLSGALLRLDLSKLLFLPLDVKTAEGGGTYNPYSPSSPLTIYATGLRNAYDLVWHSNGNLYVPTNGSSAGGNTPASVTGTLRPDGSRYRGPVVSALTNVQQTLHDYLFRVEKGGYYGHPNPLRGEFVLNGGNPTSSADSGQVNAYKKGTFPDANWRGYAYDFDKDKSPNGAIEYKNNTFNGSLKGKLMVVRYSQNKDIIILTPGGRDNNIISSAEGSSITGFSGFVDPLDLIEDPANGNLYVSEYGGKGRIYLLRPKENFPGFGSLSLKPSVINNDYVLLGDTGVSRFITVKNTGSGNLFIGSINVLGINASEFMIAGLPAFPILLRAGSSMTFKVTFAPAAAGLRKALIQIRSDDSARRAVDMPLTGFGIVRLIVYPNPVEKFFTIAFPRGYAGNINLQITDVSGKIYRAENRTFTNGVSSTIVDISALKLPTGIYFLKVYLDAKNVQVVKLFVR